MYWNNYVIVILEHRNTDLSKLPQKVANIACTYLYDDEMGRPSVHQARRLTDPTPGNPDNSEYNTLCPGLRVSSAYIPSMPGMFLSTTTGVLVNDGVGNKFMTAASHGFPSECGPIVIHPLPADGRYIGEMIMEVAHTAIGLVRLQDDETFRNITFQNDDMFYLKKLSSAKDCRTGEYVFLDSPDTGCLEGNFMATSFQRVPSEDDGSLEQQWIFTIWDYMGQDSSALPAGMCGSAIWTQTGDVLGFLKYAPVSGVMKGWCAGTAADELIKRGFTLVVTP